MGLELYEKYESYAKKDEGGNFILSEPLQTMSREVEFYTNNVKSMPQYLSLTEIENIIRSPIKKKKTKYYLLHDDETIKEDISDYVLNQTSLTKNNASGQRRSLSLTIANPIERKQIVRAVENSTIKYRDVTQLKFLPHQIWDDFDGNEKIMVVSELSLGAETHTIQEGIFVVFDPKLSQQGGNNSLNLQLYDKFALLDGTIDGRSEVDYEIAAGAMLYDAIVQLLRLPKNENGEPFDRKSIIFPEKYQNESLAYTIKKTADNTVGDLLKDIAKSISCDIYYDNYGHLVFSDTLLDLDSHYRQISWSYGPHSNELSNPSLDIKRSQIKNKVVVVGANVNGFLCRGEAKNTNPNSLYSITGTFGTKSVKITDNLIPSDYLCQTRAEYELKKSMREYVTLSFQSTWIPHLEPDDIIRISLPEWGIENEEFIVKSITLPLGGSQPMLITATNLKELSL